jgi:hypothetical protein
MPNGWTVEVRKATGVWTPPGRIMKSLAASIGRIEGKKTRAL